MHFDAHCSTFACMTFCSASLGCFCSPDLMASSCGWITSMQDCWHVCTPRWRPDGVLILYIWKAIFAWQTAILNLNLIRFLHGRLKFYTLKFFIRDTPELLKRLLALLHTVPYVLVVFCLEALETVQRAFEALLLYWHGGNGYPRKKYCASVGGVVSFGSHSMTKFIARQRAYGWPA